MFKLVSLDNPRFKESIQINPKGSIFLGYLYVELVLAGVLDGEDLKIGMPDLQVKITVDGKPRVDFPQDELVLVDGKFVRAIRNEQKELLNAGVHADAPTKWVDRYFPASAKTREAVTALAFSIPNVGRSVDRAAIAVAERNAA